MSTNIHSNTGIRTGDLWDAYRYTEAGRPSCMYFTEYESPGIVDDAQFVPMSAAGSEAGRTRKINEEDSGR